MKKRAAFTLLELMLTFSLFSLLITIFFYWTHAHLSQKKAFETIRWPLLEERYLAERIDRLLSKATITKSDPSEILQFYGDRESVVFTFDNGVYSDPLLSYKTLCFLEKREDRLECTLRPLENRGDRAELCFTLIDGVESIAFNYYQPEDPLALQVRPDQVNRMKPPVGEWARWEEGFHALPVYVALTLSRGGRSTKMFFDLHYPMILPAHQEL